MALSSLENGWKRLGRGMPAILLGTLFNVLDAVSTGLLIFPTGGHAFANLQNKSMSTYIMRYAGEKRERAPAAAPPVTRPRGPSLTAPPAPLSARS